ncbi:MAG: histidinol dehydrogenase [Ruminococcaceae bacterium]|nr:histidinol dehydrogenase [Oscillospiraceae bacterium]
MFTVYTKENVRELIDKLKKRADNSNDDIERSVKTILENVKVNGDKALLEYSEKFDKVKISSLRLSEEAKAEAIAKVPEELKRTIEKAAENIYAFHEKQKQQSWIDNRDGKIMGQRVLPLRRVGLYVPGGTAAYPSSVLMNAIPAKVAGVESIVMVTPPKEDGINPAVIYAAQVAGVTDIITVGGAQAVAAMAYGTETVEQVDKIVGPGNIFVATAKRLVFGTVDIDMFAGPSEVLVIADDKADPAYVAADFMSQAEHDPMAASVLVTTSAEMVDKVRDEIEKQLKTLSRDEIIVRSLTAYGSAVIVDTLDDAAKISDKIAPEHLELMVENPFELLGKVRNAGSVFLGANSPEPLGDYFAGPNHVLPTNGTARFSSALSTDSFVKKSSYLYYSADALKASADDIIRFAEAEGLTAHANSIKVRKNKV